MVKPGARTAREHLQDPADLPVIVAVVAVALFGLNQPLVPGITTAPRRASSYLCGSGLSVVLLIATPSHWPWPQSWAGAVVRPIPRRLRSINLAEIFSATDGKRTWFAPVARTVIPIYQVAFGLDSDTYCGSSRSPLGEPRMHEISVPGLRSYFMPASRAKSIAPYRWHASSHFGLVSRIRTLLEALVLPARGGSRAWQRRPQSTGKGLNKLSVLAPSSAVTPLPCTRSNEFAGRGIPRQREPAIRVSNRSRTGRFCGWAVRSGPETIRLMQEHPMGSAGTPPLIAGTSRYKAGTGEGLGPTPRTAMSTITCLVATFGCTQLFADLWATFGVVGFST